MPRLVLGMVEGRDVPWGPWPARALAEPVPLSEPATGRRAHAIPDSERWRGISSFRTPARSRRGEAPSRRRTRRRLCRVQRDLPQLQEATIDGRDILDGLPPTTVVVDPEPDGVSQVAGNRDLLSPPSGEGHGDVGDRVAWPLGATTGGFAASDLALKKAAPQHFFQGRQRLGDLGPLEKEGCRRLGGRPWVFHLYQL